MSDLVERLRERAKREYEMLDNIHIPLLEAAESITRLTAEVERLRAALRAAYNEVDLDAMDDNHELQRQLSKIANIASAALSPPAQESDDD